MSSHSRTPWKRPSTPRPRQGDKRPCRQLKTTGNPVWSRSISGSYYWSNAAYDSGKLFVINADGLLRAFDAASGAALWEEQLPGQYLFSAPPTADRGVVYVGGAGSGGTLYAVEESSGTVLWTQDVANGDNSSPALSDTSVFVSYVGPQVYAFDRALGTPIWHYSGCCEGGGGETPVYASGRLFTRDYTSENDILDAATGNVLGQFNSWTMPAAYGDYAVYNTNDPWFDTTDGFEARSVPSGTLEWRFAGDGQLSTAPLVVSTATGAFVYAGSETGRLYALNALTGRAIWSTNVGSPIPFPDEYDLTEPVSGLAAGQAC